MGYRKFVSELSKGIENRILAYDYDNGNCILYCSGDLRTLLIEAKVIARQRDEAVSMLRARMREGRWSTADMVLAIRDDTLVLEPRRLPIAA